MTKLPNNGNGSITKYDVWFFDLDKILKHIFKSSMTLVQISFVIFLLTLIIGASAFIFAEVDYRIKTIDDRISKSVSETRTVQHQESIAYSQAIREALQTERSKAVYVEDLKAGFSLPPIEEVISEVEQNVELHSND